MRVRDGLRFPPRVGSGQKYHSEPPPDAVSNNEVVIPGMEHSTPRLDQLRDRIRGRPAPERGFFSRPTFDARVLRNTH
jgi:hypothetical protein